jgi:hypothetical protein
MVTREEKLKDLERWVLRVEESTRRGPQNLHIVVEK